jgi:hypothetical protein
MMFCGSHNFKQLHVSVCLCMYLCTAEFFQFNSHWTTQLPDYEIMGIFREYLYWPKFLQVIFYYCSNVRAAEVIRRVLQWISPSGAGSGASVPFLCFLSLFTLYQGCQWTRRLCIIAEEIDGIGDRVSGDTTVYRHICKPFWRSSRLRNISNNCWN